jgi:HEAT repeat protein
MTRILFYTGAFALLLASCNQKKGINKFSDDTIVKIAELQDHRYADSLYQYFNHENPAYRKEAVLAFASIQDTLAIERLGKVLDDDTDPTVRAAAAYALGQIGTEKTYWA